LNAKAARERAHSAPLAAIALLSQVREPRRAVETAHGVGMSERSMPHLLIDGLRQQDSS
jgi:hypothetical protein